MFILSKIIVFFIHPVIWILGILLWGYFTGNKVLRKRLYGTGILLLILFTNPFLFSRLMLAYQEKEFEPSKDQKYSAGILLGGLSGYDRESRRAFFSLASDRFIQTVRLYKTGHIERILISGGTGSIFQSRPFREADFLRQQLLEVGIPDSCIYVERNSRNTVENAIYCKKIIDSMQLKGPFLLISSALHLPRAKRIFQKQQIEVQPYACAFTVRHSGDNFLDDVIIPSAGALAGWDALLKEIISLVVYKIMRKA